MTTNRAEQGYFLEVMDYGVLEPASVQTAAEGDASSSDDTDPTHSFRIKVTAENCLIGRKSNKAPELDPAWAGKQVTFVFTRREHKTIAKQSALIERKGDMCFITDLTGGGMVLLGADRLTDARPYALWNGAVIGLGIDKPLFKFVQEQGKVLELLHSREVETLRLVKRGLTNKEIAAELQLTEEAIRTRLQKIYEKLDVGSRYAAVDRAEKLGYSL